MQVRKYTISALIGIFFIATTAFTHNVFARTTNFESTNDGSAKSRIIASFYQNNSQPKLIAGFEVKIQDGWKIYAPDDSGFGVAPSFDFKNSTNIKSSKPIFPKAIIEKEEIGKETINYSVYKNAVVIPIELELKDVTKETNLEVEVNYGICKDLCIPVSQKFSLVVPVLEKDQIALQTIQKYFDQKIIDDTPQAKSTTGHLKISLLKAILIAFIGGAILNIMPCVLPVLSIKLLSIIEHSRTTTSRIRFAFLSTILGILFSFTIFAILTATLKSLGNAVGWGFQFQNPYFLLFLLVILMVFIANLLEMFEFNFGSSLGSILNKKIIKKEAEQKNIFIPNFLSGILAVLLATPCSAPFVGVAISFALSAGVTQIFLIFIAMGLGLALPYLILFIFPRTTHLLPKPGNWMARIKNLMAGFLAATAIWLIYILADNIGFIAAISSAILAILILLFFKKLNKLKNIWLKIITFVILIAAIFTIPNRLAYLNKMMEIKQQQHWIKFDQSQIEGLVKQGKTVVIDITADWCITCKANKLLVLSSKEVEEKLAQNNIVAMRGDLTKPDEIIFNFIKKYNRYGIPFNIVFGPGAKDGILTSELLSKDALLEAIDQASLQQ